MAQPSRIFAAFLAACLLILAGPALADPNPHPAENWKTDFETRSVELSEIISGGPPRDGIPPLDDPKFVSLDKAEYAANEPVIALERNGEARAYPLSVLMWHEIANDIVGGEPVTVTYCPLCNAAIVFSRKLDGQLLDFGTTGRLRNSDLVMYDRQTESWWQQFSGRAIIGELTGKKLKMLPSTTLPFSEFAKRFPQGRVLVPNDPAMRAYGVNPYTYYDSAKRPFLYSGEMPEGIQPMERVVIFEGASGPKVVTVTSLQEGGTEARDGVILNWKAGMASALDAPKIAKGRDTGFVTVTRDGKPVPHHVTFAFVAHAFHPEVPIEGAR